MIICDICEDKIAKTDKYNMSITSPTGMLPRNNNVTLDICTKCQELLPDTNIILGLKQIKDNR